MDHQKEVVLPRNHLVYRLWRLNAHVNDESCEHVDDGDVESMMNANMAYHDDDGLFWNDR